MKNVIVTIGEILVGVALFLLIAGDTNSLMAEATRIFNLGMTDLKNVK